MILASPCGSRSATPGPVQRAGRFLRCALCGVAASSSFMLATGCAPTQVVPLQVAPQPVAIYLDKQLLEESPDSLKLKADRDHILFFKRPGYQPQLVVLRTQLIDGKESLNPSRVEIRLQELIKRSVPNLQLKFEDDG